MFQLAAAADHRSKRLSFDEFIDDKMHWPDLPEVIHGDDVRMMELRRGSCLALKAVNVGRPVEHAVLRDLDRHPPLQLRVVRSRPRRNAPLPIKLTSRNRPRHPESRAASGGSSTGSTIRLGLLGTTASVGAAGSSVVSGVIDRVSTDAIWRSIFSSALKRRRRCSHLVHRCNMCACSAGAVSSPAVIARSTQSSGQGDSVIGERLPIFGDKGPHSLQYAACVDIDSVGRQVEFLSNGLGSLPFLDMPFKTRPSLASCSGSDSLQSHFHNPHPVPGIPLGRRILVVGQLGQPNIPLLFRLPATIRVWAQLTITFRDTFHNQVRNFPRLRSRRKEGSVCKRVAKISCTMSCVSCRGVPRLRTNLTSSGS